MYSNEKWFSDILKRLLICDNLRPTSVLLHLLLSCFSILQRGWYEVKVMHFRHFKMLVGTLNQLRADRLWRFQNVGEAKI
jgi:hypothetical protein